MGIGGGGMRSDGRVGDADGRAHWNWDWARLWLHTRPAAHLPLSTCTVTVFGFELDGLQVYWPESDGRALVISRNDVDVSSRLVSTETPPRGDS